MRSTFVLALLLFALGVGAEERGNTSVGERFARINCASCHAIGKVGESPLKIAPPFRDATGRRIHETVCADCFEEWKRNYSIKVINELRLDLSTERGAEEYDRYMREFLGIEQ